MKHSYLIISAILSLSSFWSTNTSGQAILELADNLQCGDYTYCANINMKAITGSTFSLGTSSFLLNYNTDAISFKSYTAIDLDSTTCNGEWMPHQYDLDESTGEFQLTLKLNNTTSTCAQMNATSAKTLGTVCFDIQQQGGNPSIHFDTLNTHLNRNTPDNGANAVTVASYENLDTVGVLACDCPNIGAPCDDNNVFTTNDEYDINCACNGQTLDADNDGVADGVDPCQDVNYEAEDAYVNDKFVATNHANYFGTGFVDYIGWIGDTLKFTVNATTAGAYGIDVRYANGNTYDRHLQVSIDGVVTNLNMLFPPTGSWSVWDTASFSHTFTAGTHTVLFTSNPNREPNIDRISLNDCSNMPCQVTHYEAEDAYFGGKYIANNRHQYFGTGFLDNVTWQGDTVQFTINTVDTGSHDLHFRYANGNTFDMPVTININGTVVNNNFSFLPSTAWDDWDTATLSYNFPIGTHTILLTPNIYSGPNLDRMTLSYCTGCATAGQWCNDGDSCTVLDITDVNCNCAGVLLDSDNDGVCDQADICDNGDDNIDSDSDGIPDACDNCDNSLVGTACNDNNPCTINDVYDTNCNCVGTFNGTDTDNDGVCDAFDICAGGDDLLDIDSDGIPDFCDTCDGNTLGMPCDDGNPCTVLDVVQADCGCVGTDLYVELSANINDVTCYSFDDGMINLNVAGSVGEVLYQWSTGDSIPDLQNLAPATYTVSVSDFRNCTDTASFVVNQPDTVLVQQAIVPSADSNGVIDLTVTGGIQPYSFIWETGDTTEDIDNLIPYTYDVSVTDANNCLHEVAVDIYPADMCVDTILQAESGILNGFGVDVWNERWALGDGFIYLRDDTTETATFHIDIPADGFYTIGFRYTDKWASREATIMIDNQIEFLEFAFPRTYDWANWEKIEFVDYLTAGTHTLTVAHHIDNWGPWIDFISVCNQVVVPITLDAAITDNTCYGDSAGALTILPTGGTRNYTYLWSTGDTTETITNLLSGDYYITATDEVGQMTIDTFNIGQPTEITPTFVIRTVKCNGESNGRGDVTVTGGTSGYSYQWSHGPTWRSTYNVVAGSYTLSVTDANGCLKATDITINEPDTLEAIFDNTLSTGLDGTIDMTPFGGNAPYTYYWNKDSILTQDRTGLAVGYYKVTVTDTLGCKLKTGTSVYPAGICMDTIMEAEEGLYTNMGYNIWTPDSTTGRGFIYFTADTTGIASYSFDVAENGYYAIGFRYADKWTDRKETVLIDGIVEHLDFTFPRTYNWSVYEFIDFTKYLTAGTHTLDIKHRDDWGPRIDFITVCDIALKGDVISTNINCNGDSTGSIITNITGGREPYTYTWNTGDTTPSLNNLPIGTYILTVTDTLNQVFTDTIDIIQPQPLVASISANDVSCNGLSDGQVSLNTTGGNGGYTFLWNTNDTTSTLNNLDIGNYNVLITDALGCTNTASASIIEPTILSASINSVFHVMCNGNATGSTSVLVTGGNTSYNYLWNNGDTTNNTNNLNAGNYIVTVTDNKGCQDVANITITEPALLTSTFVSSQNVDCNGNNNGQITTTAAGGTGSLNYLWDNGDTTPVINNLSGGNYALTVTDQFGCTDTVSAMINEPAVLALSSPIINNIDCYGNGNGNINVMANGGNANYQYLWNNGNTTNSINNLNAGTYIITLTDALGCTVIDSASVIEPSLLSLTYAVSPTTGNDGIIDITPLGGSPSYTYNWSDGNINEDRTALTTKNYHVTITDNNGCSVTEKFSIYDSNTCLDDIYQAENALTANGSTVNLNDTTGALGDGFVQFGGNIAETLTFNVTPSTDTIYEIGLRYSQGDSDKPLEVIIDGNVVYASLVFSKTINWNTWNYMTFKERFTLGTHTIQFKNIGANGPDIDYLSLCVTSPDTTISNYNIAKNIEQPTLIPYPNPASSDLNLDIQLLNAPQGIITIVDVNGRIMYQSIISNNGQAIIQQHVAINDYADGLYFVQLKTEKGSIVKKVTVIK
jgi:hypothetical protein